MSIEENKKQARRYYEEVHNQGNLKLLEEIAVQDYNEHDPFPGHGNGLAGLRQRVVMLRTAFPPNFTIEDMIGEGDKVVVRWTNHVVHKGEFLGIPATGKSATVKGIDIHVFRDGKMAEHWDIVDIFGLLQQLGVIPQPSGAGAR